MNQVLSRKKNSANPLREEIKRINREELRDRANLAMTRDIFAVWKIILELPEAFNLTEEKAAEFEKLMQEAVEYEAGPGSRIELDRGFCSARVFGPGGDFIDL